MKSLSTSTQDYITGLVPSSIDVSGAVTEKVTADQSIQEDQQEVEPPLARSTETVAAEPLKETKNNK
jgi:hypothetical protein